MSSKISFQNNSRWGEKNSWVWRTYKCHWRVLGKNNKKPLLFLHGFGASSAHWRNNAYFFAQNGFKVFSLDLIGFGKSDQPGPNRLKKLDNFVWSMQVADFLREVIKTTDNGKVTIIGNSLGGLVGITTAAFNHELVDSVIAAPLADPDLIKRQNRKPPRWLFSAKNKLITIFFKLLPLELIIPLIAKTNLIILALQSAYNHSIKLDSDLKRIVIEPSQRDTAPRALRAMCIGMSTREAKLTAPYLLDRIRSIPDHAKILLIWGKKDKFIPLALSKRLTNRFPWLQLSIINNAGHCPHDESPSDFNQCVLNWLKNNSERYI